MENEVLISVDLIEQFLHKGASLRAVEIVEGPDAKARLQGVEWRPAEHCVALIYDRPVTTPIARNLREPELV